MNSKRLKQSTDMFVEQLTHRIMKTPQSTDFQYVRNINTLINLRRCPTPHTPHRPTKPPDAEQVAGEAPERGGRLRPQGHPDLRRCQPPSAGVEAELRLFGTPPVARLALQGGQVLRSFRRRGRGRGCEPGGRVFEVVWEGGGGGRGGGGGGGVRRRVSPGGGRGVLAVHLGEHIGAEGGYGDVREPGAQHPLYLGHDGKGV